MQRRAKQGTPVASGTEENPYKSPHEDGFYNADLETDRPIQPNATRLQQLAAILMGVLVVLLCFSVGFVCLQAGTSNAYRNPELRDWVYAMLTFVVGPTMFVLAGVSLVATATLVLRTMRM